MSIPIADSILAARDRFVEVLADELADVLAAAATQDYPLPAPEQILTAPSDPETSWRELNIDQCALWVYRDGNSSYPQIYEGRGDLYVVDQVTRFVVAAIFTSVAGFELPDRHGRQQTEDEWLSDRAEMYRGALIDCLTLNLFDPPNVNGIRLESNGADVAQFSQMGRVARCSVAIDVFQDCTVLGTHNF